MRIFKDEVWLCIFFVGFPIIHGIANTTTHVKKSEEQLRTDRIEMITRELMKRLSSSKDQKRPPHVYQVESPKRNTNQNDPPGLHKDIEYVDTPLEKRRRDQDPPGLHHSKRQQQQNVDDNNYEFTSVKSKKDRPGVHMDLVQMQNDLYERYSASKKRYDTFRDLIRGMDHDGYNKIGKKNSHQDPPGLHRKEATDVKIEGNEKSLYKNEIESNYNKLMNELAPPGLHKRHEEINSEIKQKAQNDKINIKSDEHLDVLIKQLENILASHTA